MSEDEIQDVVSPVPGEQNAQPELPDVSDLSERADAGDAGGEMDGAIGTASGTEVVAAPQKSWKRIPVVEALQMRNEDGSYKYGKLLSAKQRFALIKSARAADAQRGANAVEQLENQLMMGEEVKREDVERMFADRPDMLKYQNDALKVYDSFVEKKKSQQRADVRFKSFLEGEKEKAEKKKIENDNNLFRCSVMEWNVPEDPDERNEQYQSFRSEIFARTQGNPTLRKTMMAELDEQVKGKFDYKGNSAYKAIMKMIDDTVYVQRNEEDLNLVDVPWFFGRQEAIDQNEKIVAKANGTDEFYNNYFAAEEKIVMTEFFRKNPGATAKEAFDEFHRVHQKRMEKEVAELLNQL